MKRKVLLKKIRENLAARIKRKEKMEHTIGYCEKCGEGHSLLDGLCYNCRLRLLSCCYECGKEINRNGILIVPPKYMVSLNLDFERAYHKDCYARAKGEARA